MNPSDDQRRLGADLGLYSITPNNHLEFDYVTLEAYKQFRVEAEAKGFRHFLEVFDPNACGNHCPADLGRFINDLIVRTLAGVPSAGRPQFLKMAYHGPRAMEELVAYDPTLVPGILGGSSGTTFDAFHLLEEAKKHGARAALFGRKINNCEHQLTFVRFLHALANGQIKADEAVKAYHGELAKLKISPQRALKDDLERTTTATSYAGGGSGSRTSKPIAKKAQAGPIEQKKYRITESMISSGAPRRGEPKVTPVGEAKVATAGVAGPSDGFPRTANGSLDFKKMTPAQKVAYSRQKIQSDLQRNNDGNARK